MKNVRIWGAITQLDLTNTQSIASRISQNANPNINLLGYFIGYSCIWGSKSHLYYHISTSIISNHISITNKGKKDEVVIHWKQITLVHMCSNMQPGRWPVGMTSTIKSNNYYSPPCAWLLCITAFLGHLIISISVRILLRLQRE